MEIKKFLIGATASVIVLGATAIPAFASNSGDGSDYGSMPGYSVAMDNTECAGHGSFNAFGKNAFPQAENEIGESKIDGVALRLFQGFSVDLRLRFCVYERTQLPL